MGEEWEEITEDQERGALSERTGHVRLVSLIKGDSHGTAPEVNNVTSVWQRGMSEDIASIIMTLTIMRALTVFPTEC